MGEYERAIQAVAAAAAERRRQMGEADDPIDDALTIMHCVIRVSWPGQNGDDIAELACLDVIICALHRDSAAALAGFNAALEANGLRGGWHDLITLDGVTGRPAQCGGWVWSSPRVMVL